MTAMETRELSGWKEIAAYLHVTPRAAQLWETDLGLPISRRPGPRGTVFTTAEALETWKSQGRQGMVRKPSTPRRSVTARLPISLWHHLHQHMERDRHTLQTVLEKAVTLYLRTVQL